MSNKKKVCIMAFGRFRTSEKPIELMAKLREWGYEPSEWGTVHTEMTDEEILVFAQKLMDVVGHVNMTKSINDRNDVDVYISASEDTMQKRWFSFMDEKGGEEEAEKEVVKWLKKAIKDIEDQGYPKIFAAERSDAGFIYDINLTLSWPWPG